MDKSVMAQMRVITERLSVFRGDDMRPMPLPNGGIGWAWVHHPEKPLATFVISMAIPDGDGGGSWVASMRPEDALDLVRAMAETLASGPGEVGPAELAN